MSYSAATELPVSAPQGIRTRQLDRYFYTGMTIALMLTVFAGFARTYFLKQYYGTPTLSPLVHLHGLAFSSWMILLLIQTTLVAASQVRVHRQLGIAGVVIVALMVVLGTVTAIQAAALGHAPPGAPPLSFLAIPLFEMITFPTLVAAGFYYRRRPDIHKRLMLLATISISSAAVARLPLAILRFGPPAFFGLTDLFIAAIVCYDLFTRRRIHPATAIGGAFVIASQILRVAVSGTAAWQSFATWLTQWAA